MHVGLGLLALNGREAVTLAREAEEDQADDPGLVIGSSLALGGSVIVDSQSADVSAGGMPANNSDGISHPAWQKAGENAAVKIHDSSALFSAQEREDSIFSCNPCGS